MCRYILAFISSLMVFTASSTLAQQTGAAFNINVKTLLLPKTLQGMTSLVVESPGQAGDKVVFSIAQRKPSGDEPTAVRVYNNDGTWSDFPIEMPETIDGTAIDLPGTSLVLTRTSEGWFGVVVSDELKATYWIRPGDNGTHIIYT